MATNIQTNVIKTDDNHRLVEFTVPFGEMDRLFDKSLGEFRKQVSMKGFRPGQIPKQLFVSRFGDEVYHETVSRVVENDLKNEFEKIVETWKTDENLEIAAPAKQHGELLAERGQDLVYKLGIALNKPLVVQGYKELGISVHATVIAEEEINDVIQKVRKRFAKEVLVERPSKFGDVVKGSYLKQVIDGVEKPLPPNPNFELEICEELDIEELKNALMGLNAGEEKEFTIHYPDSYSGSEYRGKTVDYKIAIAGIYELELPATDEFYSMVEAKDEADLKSKITDDILKDKKQKACQIAIGEAMDRLIEKNPFPVLEEQIKYTAMRSLQHNHSGYEDEEITVSEEQLNSMRPDISRAIQEERILRSIVEQEALKPTQGQVDARVQEIAYNARMDFATVKDAMRKNGQINKIREDLKLELAQFLLIGETLPEKQSETATEKP